MPTTQPTIVFDMIAGAYYTFTPTLPEQYIRLILKTFALKETDSVIDLGCGSGDLALALRNVVSSVQGVDISGAMIDLARKKDPQQRVNWIQKPVEDVDLGEKQYDLILSFESFHLFPNQKELIQRCARALKPGGSLCVGWAMYAFDAPVRNALEETFAAYGLAWDDWGVWTCPTFPQLVKEANAGLSTSLKKQVSIPAKVSVQEIVNYNLNVSKTASLSQRAKENIAQEFLQRVLRIFPTGESIGFDRYSFWYSTKR